MTQALRDALLVRATSPPRLFCRVFIVTKMEVVSDEALREGLKSNIKAKLADLRLTVHAVQAKRRALHFLPSVGHVNTLAARWVRHVLACLARFFLFSLSSFQSRTISYYYKNYSCVSYQQDSCDELLDIFCVLTVVRLAVMPVPR